MYIYQTQLKSEVKITCNPRTGAIKKIEVELLYIGIILGEKNHFRNVYEV